MNLLKLKRCWLVYIASFVLLITTPSAVLGQVQLGIGVQELSINADSSAAPVTGTAYSIPAACNMVSWITSFGTAPASVTIQLQLSNDGTTYQLADTTSLVTGEARTIMAGTRFVRAVETARSGGTLVTVSIICKSSAVASIGNQVLFADGTAANPSISFAANKFDGFYKVSTGAVGYTANGNPVLVFDNALKFGSTSPICWGPTTSAAATQIGGTADSGFVRQAAGIVLASGCDAGTNAAITASFHNSQAISALTINTNVIAPTSTTHSVGAGLVKTITVPAQCTPTCSINIIPTAAFTYDNTGNISVAAGTAVIGRVMIFVWDGTKWNPSY